MDMSADYYAVPMPVLGKLAEAIVIGQNERVLDTALENIRSRLEDGAPQERKETTS